MRWILPVAPITGFAFKKQTRPKVLRFILSVYSGHDWQHLYTAYGKRWASPVQVAKAGRTITLFLIGAGLSGNTLKAVGIKPLLQGVLLWIFISVVSLYAILVLV